MEGAEGSGHAFSYGVMLLLEMLMMMVVVVMSFSHHALLSFESFAKERRYDVVGTMFFGSTLAGSDTAFSRSIMMRWFWF